MTPLRLRAILGDTTSRRNKLALLAQSIADGDRIEWRWQAAPYASRLLVSVEGRPFTTCRSFDEDIHAKLENVRTASE